VKLETNELKKTLLLLYIAGVPKLGYMYP